MPERHPDDYLERVDGGVVLQEWRTDTIDRLQEALRESNEDVRVLERDAELLAYEVLSGAPGSDQDPPWRERLRMVKMIRRLWKKNAQVGRAVRLLVDFTVGGGVPRPRAKNPKVQAELDDFMDDPQNKRVLTSAQALRSVIVDIALDCNLFLLIFDDGDDGKIRLSLLDHDTVTRAMRDPNERHRILYFIAQEQEPSTWDFSQHREVPSTKKRTVYYEVDGALEEARDETHGDAEIPIAPKDMRGEGRIYHVAMNKTSEMIFGYPDLGRIINWVGAFQELAAARIDLQKARAAFLGRRGVQGGRSAVERIARQRLTRNSELATRQESAYPADEAPTAGPRPPAFLVENEALKTEGLPFPTGSGEAAQDAEMVRSMVAAGTGWPGPYFGSDPGPLAGATALELTVRRLVEAFQEIVEGMFRLLFDRQIEKAIEAGRIERPPDEENETALREVGGEEGGEDATDPNENSLDYDFSLPNPVKRQMQELVTSIQNIAQTFDPNNVNVELSRTLLAIVLGEALEVADPASAVERIFPEDYNPLAEMAKLQQDAGLGGGAPPPGQDRPYGGDGTSPTTSTGADGQQHSDGNPYGAPMQATPYEQVREAFERMPEADQDALRAAVLREANGGDGLLQEAAFARLAASMRRDGNKRVSEVGDQFDAVWARFTRELPGRNGHGP